MELEEDWAQRERSMIIRELEALPTVGQELVKAIAAHEGFTPVPIGKQGTRPDVGSTAGDSDYPPAING